MTMAAMTKALLRKRDKIEAEVSAALIAVYAAAPNDTTPLYCCMAMADDATRQRYDNALSARHEFESSMIREGRAWRSGSLIFWN